MILSDGERISAVWLKIEAHLKAKLEMLRVKNDGALSAEDTARLRGRIMEVKSLLELGEKPVVIPTE